METPSQQDRVRSIFQMLFEMATGNFNFRIRRGEHNDELDELANVLNMVATAMRETVINTGNIIPHYSYQSLVQTTFLLDDKFLIEGLSSNASTLLGYRPEMLFNIPFKDILSIQSTEFWEIVVNDAVSDESYHNTVQLVFVTANRKIVPSFCTVSRLLYSGKIFISSVTTILQSSLADQFGLPENSIPAPSTSKLIQDVHDYILNHLEEPLPTLKELSRLFSTNEFKIKDGFRHFFNTSVYQFYNEERLKKAHLLIQQTNEPLKSIAFSCGYNDYMNFYKAFKKRFGYPPSDLHREEGEK